MKKQISLLLMLINISAFLLSPISAYAGSQPIADDQNIDTIDASNLDSAKTTEFQYDDLYRLTRASSTNAVYGGDYLQTYAYNAIGNITNKSDQGNYGYEGNTGTRYENSHAATSIGGASYAYDNNGNLTSDGTWTHDWDYDNRLIRSTNGTTTIGYTYDQDGNRLTYSDGTATTTYVNKYYSVSTTGTTTKNIFLGDQLIATVEGNGIATSTYYIHTDHLTGSNVITDSDGQLAQLLDYYPFGDMRINEKSSSFDEKRKFTGHEYDNETDLEYMIARYYDANLGRFISADPLVNNLVIGSNIFGIGLGEFLVDPQRLNTYSYVSNNPLLYVDPYGLDKIIFYGGNKENQSYFRDIAYQNAQQMIQSGETEPIYVKEGSSPAMWNNALSTKSDISYIAYYGHGSKQALYLGNTTKTKPGTSIQTNTSASIMSDSNVSDFNPSTDITVNQLNTSNIRKGDIRIELYSCRSGVGNDSIAEAFSKHFGATTQGARGGINFNSSGQAYISRTIYKEFSLIIEDAVRSKFGLPNASIWRTFNY